MFYDTDLRMMFNSKDAAISFLKQFDIYH